MKAEELLASNDAGEATDHTGEQLDGAAGWRVRLLPYSYLEPGV